MIEKITALYARFSRDDKQDNAESVSIANQRQLLQEYADRNVYTNCRFYVDDGYTGTNFDRPDFKRMLEDVENGLVGTIIVKDMSRFGRNYILVGQYVEFILPEYDVKVIGITDNFDSTHNNNDLFAFENILNEMYTADISRKVTMVKRAKAEKGGRLKTHPIYGYRTVEGTIDDWEIDEEAANVVRMIFDMFVNQNKSLHKIVNHLRNEKIETAYIRFGYSRGNKDEPYKWNVFTIRRMLSYQEYCGDTVNGKTKNISYKTKEKIRLPSSEWKIVKDTHPAIISRELYDAAQKKLDNLEHKYLPRKYNYDTLFHRKCICSECGKKMWMDYRPESQSVFYQCSLKGTYHNNCKSHNMRDSTLRKLLPIQLEKLHNALVSDEHEIYKSTEIYTISEMKAELDKTIKRIEELQNLIKALFESKYNGELSDEDFKTLSTKYSNENNELQNSANNLTVKLNQSNQRAKEISDILNYIKQLSDDDIQNPTQEMVDKLVEKIVIGVFCGFGEVNLEKQQTDFYIYGIGKIGDIVGVSYKTYEERVMAVLPEISNKNNLTFQVLCEKLGIKHNILQVGLKKEGLILSDFKDRF